MCYPWNMFCSVAAILCCTPSSFYILFNKFVGRFKSVSGLVAPPKHFQSWDRRFRRCRDAWGIFVSSIFTLIHVYFVVACLLFITVIIKTMLIHNHNHNHFPLKTPWWMLNLELLRALWPPGGTQKGMNSKWKGPSLTSIYLFLYFSWFCPISPLSFALFKEETILIYFPLMIKFWSSLAPKFPVSLIQSSHCICDCDV